MDELRVPAPAFVVQRLTKEFGHAASILRGGSTKIVALHDVTLDIARGESLGIVGESGSGKTTLGRILVGFERPSAGCVLFDGKEVGALDRRERLAFRRQVQMVFQNPFSALNPRRTVRSSLSAGLTHQKLNRDARDAHLAALLDDVGLSPGMLDRYPHELSGGQRQRIVLARALAVNPRIIVADEPVSALDVSVQAQVLNLLTRLKSARQLTVVMITHDLRVANFFCDRVAVMYLGRLVEVGPRRTVMARAWHPYTRMLLWAAPTGNPNARRARQWVQGEAHGSIEQVGCVFRSRCWLYQKLDRPVRCDHEEPALRSLGTGEAAACHFAEMVPHRAELGLAEGATHALSKDAIAGPANDAILTPSRAK